MPEVIKPEEELLQRIRYIALVKGWSLPNRLWHVLDVRGEAVQFIELEDDNTLYFVGDVTSPKIMFKDQADGKSEVLEYKPGIWERAIDQAYMLAVEVDMRAYNRQTEKLTEAHFQDLIDYKNRLQS